ncbi:MAG: T9SS type A sorting domain-containing protein, partial [Bacteroidales bacterium]|nr:T9SS type A sorting domain-containing protein [Bacteroidales bacterium]
MDSTTGNPLYDTTKVQAYNYMHCMEFYFDSAVQITDTFLVSFRADPSMSVPTGKYHAPYGANWQENTFHNGYLFNRYINPLAQFTPGFRDILQHSGTTVTAKSMWGGAFPIVVLDEDLRDTTGTGGDDTVGISAVTGQAAIDIVPNPTDNVTTVSSAVPLRMVEAYDVAGRLLLRQPATGRTAKIDMSGYRPGCYILKIHTSAGTAH